MDKLTQAREALTERITAYLAGGGLFNPELADHDAVSQLLIDCRDALSDGEAVEPVAWQWRLKYPDGPGAIAQWETCGAEEANGHFERSPRHEYRCLYASPPDQSDAALRERVAGLEKCKLLLEGRDRFIVDNDLWPQFVASIARYGLPSARATEGGQNDER